MREQQDAVVWRQAQAATAASGQPAALAPVRTKSPGGSISSASSGGEDEAGHYSSSEAGSPYSSSPASSFSGSMQGSPLLEEAGLEGQQAGAGTAAVAAAAFLSGSSAGRSSRRGREPWRMNRAVTSRAALRPSSPGREISTHLRVG